MPSPFPGIDPFIEAQNRWHSFHTGYIAACVEMLNENLPGDYYATVEERVLLDDADSPSGGSREVIHRLGPDASVQLSSESTPPIGESSLGVIAAEPKTIPQAVISYDEPTQKFVEIRGMPLRDLVTTIELLSPTNKGSGPDRSTYLAKRSDLLRHGVNTVDLDFLLRGHRLPLLAPLPPGDFFAYVTWASDAGQCQVYSWSVRQGSPIIKVPLKSALTVAFDLQAVFNRVWDRNRYALQIRHDQSATLQLAPADREWVKLQLAK